MPTIFCVLRQDLNRAVGNPREARAERGRQRARVGSLRYFVSDNETKYRAKLTKSCIGHKDKPRTCKQKFAGFWFSKQTALLSYPCDGRRHVSIPFLGIETAEAGSRVLTRI